MSPMEALAVVNLDHRCPGLVKRDVLELAQRVLDRTRQAA